MPELRIAGARALMRVAAVLTGVSVAALGLGVPAARAETSPAVGQPLTVSADGLPTWQINGVVWSQAVVGNTVYVAGNFTRARPPGVAAGGPGEVAAQLRLRLRHHHRQPRRVVQSPAERPGARRVRRPPTARRVYVGGDFTTVDGQTRAHLAAFDTATSALSTTFKPVVGWQVRRDRDHRKHRLRGWLPPQRQRSGDGTSSRRSTPPTARAAVGPRSRRRRDRDGRGAGRLADHRRRTFHHLERLRRLRDGLGRRHDRRHPAVGGEPAHPRRRHEGRDHVAAHRRNPDLRHRLRVRRGHQVRGHLRGRPQHRCHQLS